MLHSKGISFKPPHDEKEMQDLKDGYDWLKAESVYDFTYYKHLS
jgi:hypothetical protein